MTAYPINENKNVLQFVSVLRNEIPVEEISFVPQHVLLFFENFPLYVLFDSSGNGLPIGFWVEKEL